MKIIKVSEKIHEYEKNSNIHDNERNEGNELNILEDDIEAEKEDKTENIHEKLENDESELKNKKCLSNEKNGMEVNDESNVKENKINVTETELNKEGELNNYESEIKKKLRIKDKQEIVDLGDNQEDSAEKMEYPRPSGSSEENPELSGSSPFGEYTEP
ncbi:hypothetical protein FQR65_LT07348 [Abscondita terminalis]|nr:hypothetical protein FQR65_LT07348 [Abscondita terminalis]